MRVSHKLTYNSNNLGELSFLLSLNNNDRHGQKRSIVSVTETTSTSMSQFLADYYLSRLRL